MRTRTGQPFQPLDIPLPSMAMDWLQKLKELACNADHVLPPRKLKSRMVPHLCDSTPARGDEHGEPRPAAIHRARLPPPARTHLATLGVEPQVAERCLNHQLKGVDGVFNRHDYFEELQRALEAWGQLLPKLERGEATAKAGKAKVGVAGQGRVTDQSLSA